MRYSKPIYKISQNIVIKSYHSDWMYCETGLLINCTLRFLSSFFCRGWACYFHLYHQISWKILSTQQKLIQHKICISIESTFLVKIRKYTEFKENQRVRLFGTLSLLIMFVLIEFSNSLNFFFSLSETGNSIYLRLYRP